MNEAQRVVLQEAAHCRKCGRLLQPGEVVRAYPRQGGWAYYCAERCGKPAGANPYPKPDGRPSQAQALTPTPNRPTGNQELVSLKDLVAVEQEKLKTLILLVQEVRDLHADLHELQKALEGQTAMAIGISDTMKELVQALRALHPSSR